MFLIGDNNVLFSNNDRVPQIYWYRSPKTVILLSNTKFLTVGNALLRSVSISLQNKNADFISGIDNNSMFRFTKLMLSRLFRADRHEFVELSRRFPFSLSRLK